MTINIQQFTGRSHSDTKKWMRQPFNFMNKTIATNGCALILQDIDQQDKKYKGHPQKPKPQNSPFLTTKTP